MDEGSDEYKAGLEAMGVKKGITPSGSAANLHQIQQPSYLRNSEAMTRTAGIVDEVPVKQKRKGSTGRLQDNNNSFTHSQDSQDIYE